MSIAGMDPTSLAAFATTSFLLNITPGPAVMQVVGHSMVNGWRPAQASVLGILAANGMYCMLAALGLGALVLAVPQLFEAVKWVGMAYLAWLGIRALRSACSADRAGVTRGPAARPSQLFRQSFLLQGANPKSVLTFCALLPAFVGSADGASARIVVLGFLAIAWEYPVLLAYSAMASKARALAFSGRGRRILDALSGCALLGAAGSVAATSLQRR